LNDADFQSLDTTGITGARQADGSLPELKFARLVSTSDLIDAGVNVGLSYSGAAPDIGAYEFDPTKGVTVTTLGSGTGNNLMVDKNGRIIIIQ
jgi:hypothetical protein